MSLLLLCGYYPCCFTVIEHFSFSYGQEELCAIGVSSFLDVFTRLILFVFFFFFQAEDGIRDLVRSRGLGDVYKRQPLPCTAATWPLPSG